MIRKNKGFAVDPAVNLDPSELTRGQDAYQSWHWGVKPKEVFDWGDKDMPRMLVECGRLVRLHIRSPSRENPRHPRRERDTMIQLSKSMSDRSHVAYDPDHPYERLYLLIDPQARQTLRNRFWDNNAMPSMPLNDLALIAGGKHARKRDYPDVNGKAVGILTAIVYYTHKKGDENPGDARSYYIHQVGEISGALPFLCADQQGRLWIAGGSTTAPSPGIMD